MYNMVGLLCKILEVMLCLWVVIVCGDCVLNWGVFVDVYGVVGVVGEVVFVDVEIVGCLLIFVVIMVVL